MSPLVSESKHARTWRHACRLHLNLFFLCVCCILAYTPHTDAFTYTKYSFGPLLLFKHHSTYCMNCVHVCHECSSMNDNVAKSALSLQELAQNEGAFVFLQYIFTCLPFLLSPVFLGVRAGSTMVLVWDLTIAIMNGSEREGRARERERQKGATGSSLHTTLSFFSFF